jgi:hypothetical protein
VLKAVAAKPASCKVIGGSAVQRVGRRAEIFFMWKLTAAAAFCLALVCSGCDVRTKVREDATKWSLDKEMKRYVYTEELGPTIVASMVFASAPAGGPAASNAIIIDRAWGTAFASIKPEDTYIPSIFEVPDPNRKPRFGPVIRTRQATTGWAD